VKAAALVASLLLSACLVAVALARPGAWWLTWFALLPLFLAIRVLPPVRALIAGAVWGLWVFIFSVLAVETTVAPTARSLALLVAIPAIYTCLAALLTRWIGFVPLVLAYGWMGVEFALAPLGLRGGLLGSAHSDGLLGDSVGRLLGYVFVAFVLASANASVLAVLTNARVVIPSPRSLGAFTGSPRACFSSQISFFVQFLAPHQACPRAPPIAP
jgi:apolipoprotein N-acyltransferase